MQRKKLTVYDYLKCKGKRQLSVLFVHNVEEAKAAEEEAHAAVDTAASTAQAAHELMQEIRKEVHGLREKHTGAHRKVEGFRRIADTHHRRFVVGMRVMQSIDGIMNTSTDDDTNSGTASVEARDLMDLLMSGETLGLDDLMAFQRNN